MRVKIGKFSAEVTDGHYRIWRGRLEGYGTLVPIDEWDDFLELVGILGMREDKGDE